MVRKVKATVLIVAMAMWASACGATVQQLAQTADSAAYIAITHVDDLEWSLYQSTAITPEQHAAVNPKVIALLTEGRRFNEAVRAKLPVELTALQTALKDVVAAVDALPLGNARTQLDAALADVSKKLGGQ